MVHNNFYSNKTAKKESNITNIREMYGCIEISMHCFTVFNIPIHY